MESQRPYNLIALSNPYWRPNDRLDTDSVRIPIHQRSKTDKVTTDGLETTNQQWEIADDSDCPITEALTL